MTLSNNRHTVTIVKKASRLNGKEFHSCYFLASNVFVSTNTLLGRIPKTPWKGTSMKKKNKTRKLDIRITEEEWQDFDRLVKQLKVSKSGYIRSLMKGFAYTGCPTEEAMAAIKVLNEIRDSLNALVKEAQRINHIDWFVFHECFQKIENYKAMIVHVGDQSIEFKEDLIKIVADMKSMEDD